MRRLISRLVWLAFGIALAVFVLECVLRFLPVSMGRHRTEQFDRWPLQSLQPGLRHAYSISWSMQNAQRGTTNNYGHIAPFDYKKNTHPIIVIGDSYVESLMNPYGDTLQAQLAQKFAEPDAVYGLGVSGLSASDYVALSRQAKEEFNPAAAVFLITDGDFSESLGYSLGNYYLQPNGESLTLEYAPMRDESIMKKIRKAIGEIAIYRYFLVNLQFSSDKIFQVFKPQATAQVLPDVADQKAAAGRRVVDWFLHTLPTQSGLSTQCIAFLVDSDRYAIYKADLATPRKDRADVRRYFIEQAQQRGFRVSDLEPIFKQRYAATHIKFDHYPVDRHWNRVGHAIGAEEAYRLLRARGENNQPACLNENTTSR
jgi:hypothetical protein